MTTAPGKISALLGQRRVAWRSSGMRLALTRRSNFINAAFVLVLVLLAGSRLVTLSLQRHAMEARGSAEVVLDRYGRSIESGLEDLARDAQRQRSTQAPIGSLPQGRNVLRIAADGAVLESDHQDSALVQAVMREWASAAPRSGAANTEFLGPIRYGSQWFVTVRVAVPEAGAKGVARQAGGSIAYQTLDTLLSGAGLGSSTTTAYDFELSQRAPKTWRSRVLWTTAAQGMAEPVERTIRLPASLPQSLEGAALTIAARPREGWYPVSTLLSDMVLLMLVAWVLTVSAYDVSRNTMRLRAAIAAGKRRVHEINQRLMKEIEQRQSLQKSFDHARYHDAFTGLPNRSYFVVRLEQTLRELRKQSRHRIAVMLIDIDRFQLVNDRLGHTAGDELMVQAARRFEHATAPFEGVLARWGGDQFAQLLFDVHSSDTAIGAANLLRESLREPFKLRKHHVSIAVRIGVTCIEAGSRRAEEVLREADLALSMAKSQPDTPVVAYDPSMTADPLGLVSLQADLHVALERHELRLLFQPIVDLRAGRIVAMEALLRWQHPVEGLLTPDRFLSIAEDAGLLAPITRWTIERACRVAGEWARVIPETDFYISVNLSAATLRDPGLIEHVASTLTATNTPARMLKFELTESGLISNLGAASEVLGRLHGMGIELLLDDFGTGYSSLTHLQVFPFDYVKIDQPFAKRFGSEEADRRMTSAMIEMVSSLGLKVIGETVETEASAQALQRAGCDFGQGFFFCEPVESAEALRRLQTQDYRRPPRAIPSDETRAAAMPEPPRAGRATVLPVSNDSPAPAPADPTLVLPFDDSTPPVPPDPTLVLPLGDSLPPAPPDQTLVLPLDDSIARAPPDPTLVLPLGDSLPPAPPDQTLVLPLDDSIARAPPDPTLVLPLGEPPLPGPSDSKLPTDPSPTEVLSLEELALPIDNSRTLAQEAAPGLPEKSDDDSAPPGQQNAGDAPLTDRPRVRRHRTR